MSERNPFFSVSTLPYQAPPFDVIDDSHYRPVFDEASGSSGPKFALLSTIRSRPVSPTRSRRWSRVVSCWRG